MHARVCDHAGPDRYSHSRACPCCLPLLGQRRRPELTFYRGSMAGLLAPLSTLRDVPRGDSSRMTRGQYGLLFLYRLSG